MKSLSSYVIILSLLLLTACSQQNKAENAINQAEDWLNILEIDLNDLAKRKLADKKHLAEALGAYWRLYRFAPAEKQQQIKKRLDPLYAYTKKPEYVSYLANADDKSFKKNSMSYLRIMWLLDELGYDITHLRFGLAKFKGRMDAHLTIRGPWQKGAFDRYYDFFKLSKPAALNNAKTLTHPISARLTVKQYEKTFPAYALTHQVFVAFMYGAEKTQTRFNQADLNYLDDILPKVTAHYIEKKNWDLASEFLLCMIYLKQTDKPAFKAAYKAILDAQNENGSWGDYERLRASNGKYVEIRYYLHTTGVVLGSIVENERGDWK